MKKSRDNRSRGLKLKVRERVAAFKAKGTYRVMKRFLSKKALECDACGNQDLHLATEVQNTRNGRKHLIGPVCLKLTGASVGIRKLTMKKKAVA